MSLTTTAGKTFAMGVSLVSVVLCLSALYFGIQFLAYGSTLALSKAIVLLVLGIVVLAAVAGGEKLVEAIDI